MCPDENTLLRFARGEAGELPAIEAHLDGCESCRRAVAAAASEQTLPATRAPTALTPGMRVARYEIERELGRGGMGIVYQSRDVTLDRRVALKLLHARRDEAAQARLLREAQVMARLAHPSVVPVFELGEWNGELYLVMELVGGVTLDAWLKRDRHPRRDISTASSPQGTASPPRTPPASCIATSSPPTSSSAPTVVFASPTLACPVPVLRSSCRPPTPRSSRAMARSSAHSRTWRPSNSKAAWQTSAAISSRSASRSSRRSPVSGHSSERSGRRW